MRIPWSNTSACQCVLQRTPSRSPHNCSFVEPVTELATAIASLRPAFVCACQRIWASRTAASLGAHPPALRHIPVPRTARKGDRFSAFAVHTNVNSSGSLRSRCLFSRPNDPSCSAVFREWHGLHRERRFSRRLFVGSPSTWSTSVALVGLPSFAQSSHRGFSASTSRRRRFHQRLS